MGKLYRYDSTYKGRVQEESYLDPGLFGLPERSQKREKKAISCYTNESLKVDRKREMAIGRQITIKFFP